MHIRITELGIDMEQSRHGGVLIRPSGNQESLQQFFAVKGIKPLIGEIEVNRNYQKSDLLQVIRILKNYDFFKEPQLELFRTKRKKPAQAKNQKIQL